MTDFFGGVASVEVMGKEGILPVLGRKVGKWEEVSRRKGIENERGVAHREGMAGNHSTRLTQRGDGWVRPLDGHNSMSVDLRGLVAVVGVAGIAYSWMTGGVKRKVD